MYSMSWCERPKGLRTIVSDDLDAIASVYLLICEVDYICTIHVRHVKTGAELDPEKRFEVKYEGS